MRHQQEGSSGKLPGSNKSSDSLKFGLIGVPTNSSGNRGGVANAPAALRHAGLVEAISRIGDVQDKGNAAFSMPSATSRDTKSGIIAYDSLISM
ncbi:MAG: hypothetical protein MN733_00765, partial [Nitrososphaera sp.]|nr:hypothetical protein [Nitrososphaera sp.]